jgi:arylsulfatase A-like enzyme
MTLSNSVVLVTVDCLRADHTGFLGYDRPTTPFLDQLASQSVVFRNATAAGIPTYHSLPSIMASRFPLSVGRDVVGLARDEPTIASVLRERGFKTAGFVAGNPYLSKRYGYQNGFDVFEDFLNVAIDPGRSFSGPNGEARSLQRLRISAENFCHGLGPIGAVYDRLYFRYAMSRAKNRPRSLDQLRRYPAADLVVDAAAQWLAEINGEPFFLWLHFMDPHGPYYPPEDALRTMGNSELTAARATYLNWFWNRDFPSSRRSRHLREITALYDAGIRWVDAQLNRLANVLQDLHTWNECIFAVTADHGEEFLDHGGAFHFPPKLTQEMIHVPLLLRDPDVTKAFEIANPFSLVDLAPTLLEAVGVTPPSRFTGTSHWRTLRSEQPEDREVITEALLSNPCDPGGSGSRLMAVRHKQYKVIVDFSAGTDRLFNLENDPHELHPLPAKDAADIRKSLLLHAQKHLANSAEKHDSSLRLTILLRELGHTLTQPASHACSVERAE